MFILWESELISGVTLALRGTVGVPGCLVPVEGT